MTNFKPMLAKDGDPSKISFPVVAQPKLDGIRASVVNGKLVSRTLKPIPNDSIRAFLERPEFEGLDGEILVGSPTADDAYRQTTSFVMAPSKTGAPWTFHVFDKWDHPGPFRARYDAADDAVNGVPDTPHLSLVPSWTVADEGELGSIEARVVAEGHEGVIVRTPDAPYKFGRSGKTGPLLKIKRFVDFEAEVIGVYEEMHNTNEKVTNELGRGQRSTAKAGLVGKGRLGGLILRTLDPSDPDDPRLPDAGIEFRCGTGFNADDRAALWVEATCPNGLPPLHATLEGLNGRTAKVKSFPVGVKDKPRHPVFLGWREAGA